MSPVLLAGRVSGPTPCVKTPPGRVLDAVGGEIADQALAATADGGGRIGFFGYASGAWPTLDAQANGRRDLTVCGPLGLVIRKSDAEQRDDASQAPAAAARGELIPRIHADSRWNRQPRRIENSNDADRSGQWCSPNDKSRDDDWRNGYRRAPSSVAFEAHSEQDRSFRRRLRTAPRIRHGLRDVSSSSTAVCR